MTLLARYLHILEGNIHVGITFYSLYLLKVANIGPAMSQTLQCQAPQLMNTTRVVDLVDSEPWGYCLVCMYCTGIVHQLQTYHQVCLQLEDHELEGKECWSRDTVENILNLVALLLVPLPLLLGLVVLDRYYPALENI